MRCIACDGKGKDWDWKDRDVIEGFKLAPQYKCIFCNGTTEISESDIRYEACIAYRDTLANTIERKRVVEAQRKKEKEKLIKSGLKKLTAAEKKALGL